MVVSSTKCTILISWSLICIPLIILSVLMIFESISTGIMYNSMESRHPWRTRIMVKGSDRRSFILFYSKDITEGFLFSLFDTSTMSQIVGRV